jgi:hypothetical protein
MPNATSVMPSGVAPIWRHGQYIPAQVADRNPEGT